MAHLLGPGPYEYVHVVGDPAFNKDDFFIYLQNKADKICPIAEGYHMPGVNVADHVSDANGVAPNIFEHPAFDIDHFIAWVLTPVEE